MAMETEKAIHIAVMDYVRLKQLDNITFHVPNGGRQTPQRGAMLKRMGVLAGVSDLIMARQSRGFGALFLELKAKKGRLSDAQKAFLNNMIFEGYCVKVAHSLDEAIEAIDWYTNKK